MKRLLKENSKILIGVVFGLLISSIGVYAATTIAGNDITYSNTKSGLSSTNVQGAIDELYEKANSKFVKAYTYNETSGASNYCITGEESTCQSTTCYRNKTANSCPTGTIIFYRVNELKIEPFYVMFDHGNKMTMQSQKNTINNVQWCSKDDFLAAGGTEEEYTRSRKSKGPITTLKALENATKSWVNVNDQTYTLGTTSFSGKGSYTGCSYYNSCTTNVYTLPERTAKARLITVQEAASVGCTMSAGSCPIWMYNYLGFAGSEKMEVDSSAGPYYWSSSTGTYASWYLLFQGNINTDAEGSEGARAVVEVSK